MSNKHNAIVELLLDNENIDVNCRDNQGNTPLHAAVEVGDIADGDVDDNAFFMTITGQHINTILANKVDNVFGVNLLLRHRNMASLNFRWFNYCFALRTFQEGDDDDDDDNAMMMMMTSMTETSVQER